MSNTKRWYLDYRYKGDTKKYYLNIDAFTYEFMNTMDEGDVVIFEMDDNEEFEVATIIGGSRMFVKNGSANVDTDTDNMTEYVLTCNQIRDFCKDAIRCGEVPSDTQIDSLVGRYKIEVRDV